MPKYVVKAHETFYYEREVEADSPDEAMTQLKANGLLDWLDYENETSDWVIDNITEVTPN